MEYRIFPPIGIARIGNSPDFFVGPEVLGSLGREIGASGESEVQAFKDSSFRTKKQAARFRLYERANPTVPFVPATIPTGATVRWSVQLVNKKDGIVRPSGPPPAMIPAGGLRPKMDASRANRVVDSGVIGIDGIGSSGKFLDGTHVGVSVRLGELRTDAEGNLLVLAGNGVSKSNPVSSIGSSFYNNINWYDDVADGPVNAEITFANGTTHKAIGAWVASAPPDFAPSSAAVVTLFDIIEQLAIKQTWLPKPTATSFTQHIYPLFRRARSLRWSHIEDRNPGAIASEPNWNAISDDFTKLSDASATAKPFRVAQQQLIANIETGKLAQYNLTASIRDHLQRWVDGNFSSDWAGVPAIASSPTPESLTRATLDGTAGQGFFPGIEAGRIVTDPSLYLVPFDFRIDQSNVNAGDLTALMAQPWQADFLKCRGHWWPSQRPDIAPQANQSLKMWARINGRDDRAGSITHQELVDHVMQFGVISPKMVGGVEVAVEEGRDPAIGP